MSKTYKGYELYKMIAEGKIAEGTKFRDWNSLIWGWNGINFQSSKDYADIVFSQMDFELIEDEIDIQSIETFELQYLTENESNMRKIDVDIICKINEIAEAVKQLDKNKEDKQC